MKNTQVKITFNGMTVYYTFEQTIEEFMPIWNNQMAGQGYFSGVDVDGVFVNINPTCCPVVEIAEKY